MGHSSSKMKPPKETRQENDVRVGTRPQTEYPLRTESKPAPVNITPIVDRPPAKKAAPGVAERITLPQESIYPSPPVSLVAPSTQREELPIPKIGPGDTVIAVMGLTGVGKSRFISHYSDRAKVGKTLKSCTTDISIHPACIDGKTIYLVDTPGFDDKDRTDVDILRDTASWLWEAYDAKVKLAGVVYLHRIQDNRVSGTIAQNIDLFRELCGKNGLASVVLATTMWDISPDRATLEARERELKTEDAFWGRLVKHGCTVMRQDSGINSATRIIRHILAQQPVTLLLQEEIAEGAKLHQTAAGVVLTTRLEEQKKRYDEEMEQLRKEYEKIQERMRQVQEELGHEKQERKREKDGWEHEKKASEDEKKASQNRQTAWEKEKKDMQDKIDSLNKEIHSTKQKQEQTNTDHVNIKKGLVRRFWAWVW